jgi:FkbH-like protein
LIVVALEISMLDPGSDLRADVSDLIVVALEISMLDQAYGDTRWSADQAIRRMEEMYEALRRNTSSVIVINTLMSEVLSQEASAKCHSSDQEVTRANDWICQFAESNKGRFVVADWVRLLLSAGQENAIDRRFWRTSLAPFKAPFLDLYAREIAKVVRALKGKAKKCLVLDCDDTLWGGVVGEDGLNGITLGTTELPGKAYYEFQQCVLGLRERGVIVALCSKNNVDDVWEVMERHPDCLLQKSDLAAWRINWEDKATNIVAISDELNLSFDSLVFVDDNPRECQLIRESLPQVTVLQVPEALAGYADLLLRDGLFDTLSVSEEDRHRASLYSDQKQRLQERDVHVDLDDYLASLAQIINIWEASDEDRPRVAQLTQKTNQFNLTTKRYSEGQIEAFIRDKNAAVFTMSVSDRYGKLGTTGVLIARRVEDVCHIDTLLLSCRILGRKLEYAFVDKCMQNLEVRWGLSSWKAEYLPTKKNAQVAEFWERIGFSLQTESDSMKSYSRAAGQRVSDYEHVMSIVEAGVDAGSN